MTVELNHTIVHAHDKQAAAEFLARILNVGVGAPWGLFVPVTVDRVTLDSVEDGAESRRRTTLSSSSTTPSMLRMRGWSRTAS
jgi:hypothetical protein